LPGVFLSPVINQTHSGKGQTSGVFTDGSGKIDPAIQFDKASYMFSGIWYGIRNSGMKRADWDPGKFKPESVGNLDPADGSPAAEECLVIKDRQLFQYRYPFPIIAQVKFGAKTMDGVSGKIEHTFLQDLLSQKGRRWHVISLTWAIAHIQPSWDLQEQYFRQRVEESRNLQQRRSSLPICSLREHYPVYTLGKSGKESNFLSHLAGNDAELVKINRGGDITFSRSGAIGGLSIFRPRAIAHGRTKYIWSLEEVIIQLIADYGLHGERWKVPAAYGSM
jgi:hypothetical protein